MKIGVIYPQIELQGDPEAVRRFGLAAEELGYDYLLGYDHVLGAEHSGREPKLSGPYTEKDPFHDPLMMFAYLAGITKRLEFASGVIILPQRQTALVARQAADLALLSGGRFRLGVGLGWNWVEYEALGEDFSTRGKRLEEQVALLRELWSGKLVTHHGRFDHIERAALVPAPKKPIEIWFGGANEVALKRAGKLADGFMFIGAFEDSLRNWEIARAALREAGRDEAKFGREYLHAGARDAEKAADALKRWRDSGGTHASFATMQRGFTTADAHIDFMAQVRRKLG